MKLPSKFALKCIMYMIALPLVLLLFSFVFSFAYWEARGTDSDRSAAVEEAFNLARERAVNAPIVECTGNDATDRNPACIKLTPQRRLYCRWWVLERCRSYSAHQYILTSQETAGKFFDAVLNPCKYIFRDTDGKNPPRYSRSLLDQDCSNDPKQRKYPIVIVFKGNEQDIRIRID